MCLPPSLAHDGAALAPHTARRDNDLPPKNSIGSLFYRITLLRYSQNGFLAKRSNPSVVCFATTDPMPSALMITFMMMVEYTVAVASLLVVWLHRLFDNGSRKHGHFFACCSMFCFALALSWERIEDGFWPRQIFCSLRPRRI